MKISNNKITKVAIKKDKVESSSEKVSWFLAFFFRLLSSNAVWLIRLAIFLISNI